MKGLLCNASLSPISHDNSHHNVIANCASRDLSQNRIVTLVKRVHGAVHGAPMWSYERDFVIYKGPVFVFDRLSFTTLALSEAHPQCKPDVVTLSCCAKTCAAPSERSTIFIKTSRRRWTKHKDRQRNGRKLRHARPEATR